MKISFVIPAHNAAAWLPPAVASVLAQTHKDIECIIVNDGSTDSTQKYLTWLEKRGDQRVKILQTERFGRSGARNFGNGYASGEVICVLDADDLAYPKRAEIVAREFDRGAEFLYGSAVIIDAIGTKKAEEIAKAFDSERAMKTLLNGIVHSTVAYTKKIAERFPYKAGELADLGLDDWAQQTEIAMAGIHLRHVSNALSVYRNLKTGISVTRDQAKVDVAKRRFLEMMKVTA